LSRFPLRDGTTIPTRQLMQPTDWRKIAASCGIHPSAIDHPTIHIGQMLCTYGERPAAEAACREILHRRPGEIAAWKWLTSFLEVEGRFAEAEFCCRRGHELDLARSGLPAQLVGRLLRFRMAAEGYGRGPAKAPRSYVSDLFDHCAEEFNDHLRRDLQYRGPELVCGSLIRAIRRRRRPLDILDAGCGTGLAAPLLKPHAARLEGVDLSEKMLEKAQARSLYGELHKEDLVKFLAKRGGCYDAIVAVDVLVYFGNLGPVLRRAHAALRRWGLFAFSVEAAADGRYALAPTRRYVHSESYLRRSANRAGFRIVDLRRATLRLESTQPVASLVAVLRK
jgi:predicted TPR repeat methyltransferase